MWVDYWGAKGYVAPPLQNYWGGGGGLPPSHPLPTPMTYVHELSWNTGDRKHNIIKTTYRAIKLFSSLKLLPLVSLILTQVSRAEFCPFGLVFTNPYMRYLPSEPATFVQRLPNVFDNVHGVWNTFVSRWTNVAGSSGIRGENQSNGYMQERHSHSTHTPLIEIIA